MGLERPADGPRTLRAAGLAGLLVPLCLVLPRVSPAGTVEARLPGVELRLGEAKPVEARPATGPGQRTTALAYESRWRAASLLLLRSLELRLRRGPPSGNPAPPGAARLPAPTFLMPIQFEGVARPPWVVLESFRVPRDAAGAVPPGCEAFAACAESIAAHGNRALELASMSPAPEPALRAGLAALDRAFERTARAAAGLRLRLGPATDSTEWAGEIEDEPLAGRWRAADSLERALLVEGGASPTEVASYSDWVRRGSLPLACTDCASPEFWAAAREALRAQQPGSQEAREAAETGSRVAGARPPRSLSPADGELTEEWFDAMGRRVWSESRRASLGEVRAAPAPGIPRGVYFVRRSCGDRRWTWRVVELR